LNKIINLLPLVSPEEYNYRFPSEQAISFIQLENQLMCSPNSQLTWDNLIDLLLIVHINPKVDSNQVDHHVDDSVFTPNPEEVKVLDNVD
jgi:hypothetical protein